MIPQRVKLRGFLCYKDEQEIDFDSNATLWMLSGLNGSGKSSIFDAVTYALFGHHRGGGQHAGELINKDSDTLLVEFDFLLDGRLFRAKRTLRRDTRGGTRGTQQVFRYDKGENGQTAWVAVEGTGQKREFDSWVAENIGLNYDTFTSSVLLLQGRAEKLLDSKPEGRREVLARIVDLERYEHLHRKADDQRKAQEAQLKGLASRLANLPPIPPLELLAADRRIEEAEEARQQARAEVERLQGVEHQIKGWQALQSKLRQARERHQKAQELLSEAGQIEQTLARLQELRSVLPRLHEITGLRGTAHEAEVSIRDVNKQKQKWNEQLAQREQTLSGLREQRSTTQAVIAAEETRQREVATQLHEVAGHLERVKECEQHEADLLRIREEIARLPQNPNEEVTRARARCDQLQGIVQSVPLLIRFHTRRKELGQSLEALSKAEKELQLIHQRGEQCGAEVKKLEPELQQAIVALQEANDHATEARTLLQQAEESLRVLSQLDGSKVCRHCGQALTEGHLQEEKTRRNAAVQQARTAQRTAANRQSAAQKAEQQKREALEHANRVLQEARLEYREVATQVKAARAEVERLQSETTQAYEELPPALRQCVAPAPVTDWLTTTYPTSRELQRVRKEAEGMEKARKELQQAETLLQQWNKLKVREEASQEVLHRLQGALPADPQGIRTEHARLSVEVQTLEKGLKARRQELQRLDAEMEQLTQERDESKNQVGQLDTQLKHQEVVLHHAEQTMAKVIRALPESWQSRAEKVGLREYNEWEQEKTTLERDGVELRARQLQQARLECDVLLSEQQALETEQEQFPEEARQDPAQLATLLLAARDKDRTCDAELAKAREERALLENHRKQREEAEQEYLEVEKELASQKLLAELLGRERLQLYLVRQAERQVVEHANAVLDRLSGGQLYLKLVGEAEGEGSLAKALELEAYNRATGEKPINVAFLSGSQKFRVAVSLALGIGQYASRQHRPIESVIIDEGFGCLDAQGRQVMIQELQNLRGQMRCILLVSHQEEFAEAFADGYHFALEEGSTRVRRFQR